MSGAGITARPAPALPWPSASELITEAFGCACLAHAGQRRKGDRTEFLGHPLEVAELVAAVGAADQVVAAALLHDAVEDSELTLEEIADRFGEEVGQLVAALTEDRSILDYAERKRAQRATVATSGTAAVTIYVADKLSNVRDMRRGYSRWGEAIASRYRGPLDVRIALWHEDLELCRSLVPELRYLGDLAEELARLGAERGDARAA